jgi:hypothetical protein
MILGPVEGGISKYREEQIGTTLKLLKVDHLHANAARRQQKKAAGWRHCWQLVNGHPMRCRSDGHHIFLVNYLENGRDGQQRDLMFAAVTP